MENLIKLVLESAVQEQARHVIEAVEEWEREGRRGWWTLEELKDQYGLTGRQEEAFIYILKGRTSVIETIADIPGRGKMTLILLED